MDIDLAALPDDVDTLQRMVRTLVTERVDLTEANPTRQSLQPEAIGAVIEVTKWRPAGHLEDFRGVLQVDGYAGFERLTAPGDIVLAACWVHARRKFYDLHEATGSPIAAEALRRITSHRVAGTRGPSAEVQRGGQTPDP